MPSGNTAPVPKTVLDLVERFENNRDSYKSQNYNETQVRREFIDPLFKALGWDIDNEKGYAEAYKDVIHEDAVQFEKGVGAPDYCFRIGGARKFFLEAKKPAIDIKHDPSPAYQLRRYAWTTKLPLSVLTDFEEFAVYDCRVKPDQKDKSSVARILYIPFSEYATRWEEIAGIFSREAVLKGSFDKYAEENKAKRGTADVDDDFLKTLETWRKQLAENLALRNEELSQRELNFAVQRIIDRIIFLRICEGRGIEDYSRLQKLAAESSIYERLGELFREADDRYNSGLFHFQPEKGRHEPPDELTLSLNLDDKLLRGILRGLYYPESPYVFSKLPADVLGHVYEQFLGKVIRLTEGHHAKVEDKPEVKKAGGVYYTPTYIVEYIVQNTVGKLLEGKTPKQAARLKILDPACGSGSFLLGAYEYLLNWHLKFYSENDPAKWARGSKPVLVQSSGGEYKLSIDERKRILLDNIFGVDIDAQAVETTKLSLLLKVLEGETQQSLQPVLRAFQERALPDLGDNIKCGNSLIAPDFNQQQLLPLAEEEQYRINVFDWRNEFLEIFKQGGFDAVIGNPPYGAFFSDAEKDYVRSQFKSYKYRFDSYIYFLEKAITLAKKLGLISFITPELWLKLENCAPLRRLISENTALLSLRICGEDVFSSAVVNTIVVVLERGSDARSLMITAKGDSWQMPTRQWQSAPLQQIDYRLRADTANLVSKITKAGRPLSDFGDAIQGITPYDKYRGQSASTIKNRAFHFDHKHDDTCGKWLSGKDVNRYSLGWSGEWLKYGEWLAAPREPRFFTGHRLLFREVPGKDKRIQATIAGAETLYHGHSITPFRPHRDDPASSKYLLGIVNSKLLSWYGGLTLPNFGKDIFPKLNPQDILRLPVRAINFSDQEDKSRHDQIVKLVDRMLDLHKRLPAAKTPQERTSIERQIAATDAQIDRLVYGLYGLTQEEIKIVEGSRPSSEAEPTTPVKAAR